MRCAIIAIKDTAVIVSANHVGAAFVRLWRAVMARRDLTARVIPQNRFAPSGDHKPKTDGRELPHGSTGLSPKIVAVLAKQPATGAVRSSTAAAAIRSALRSDRYPASSASAAQIGTSG